MLKRALQLMAAAVILQISACSDQSNSGSQTQGAKAATVIAQENNP